MVFLKKVAAEIHRPIQQFKYNKTTAKQPRHNDVYIVAFPKSGITWLSAMLANAALLSSDHREVANYITTCMYIPDIHISRDIGDTIYQRPPVRMIKSHSAFNPNYNFVILLVRHPLHVMKSYYRFTRESGRTTPDFSDFIRSEQYGLSRWRQHVNSWLNNDCAHQRLHLCKYEDFIENPGGQLTNIINNFGWMLTPDAVQKAICRTDVETMKKSESLYRKNNPNYSIHFVQGGDIKVSKNDIEYVNATCSDELKLLGYTHK